MIAIAIHGGAGSLPADATSAEHARDYRASLQHVLETGHAELARGNTAIEAVVRVIALMEDSGLYNAGRGAVANDDGEHELDASIMNGATLDAGAVACVRKVRNPIALARCVMDHSPHVLLTGRGAEDLARTHGLALVNADYYAGPHGAVDSLHGGAALANARTTLDHGTVGAVAIDQQGNLAAGTSTGGTTGKRAGRVGDSPIIGAGTYAANASCAVSATGTGEHFIRAVAAHDVAALISYRGESVQDAVAHVLARIGARGGDGGLIAVDTQGRIAMAFNTQRMYRASIDGRGVRFIGIGA